MSKQAIRAALEQALNAMTPPLETEWENAGYTATAGVPYQKAYLLSAETENPEIGGDHYREVGFLQVTLCYPTGTGPRSIEARGQQIINLFKRGNTYVADGVRTTILRTGTMFPAIIDGDRYCVPVRVRYFANVAA